MPRLYNLLRQNYLIVALSAAALCLTVGLATLPRAHDGLPAGAVGRNGRVVQAYTCGAGAYGLRSDRRLSSDSDSLSSAPAPQPIDLGLHADSDAKGDVRSERSAFDVKRNHGD
jgi:hypothetical protein